MATNPQNWKKVGNPGTNRGKPHIRTIEKARIAVRLELRNMGIPLSDIAAHVGMTSSSFSLLRKTRLYRILKQQYFTGILSVYDENLIDDIEANTRTLKAAVPIALDNLVTFAADRTDKRICMEATKEILNRNGHFAPVSRIGLPTNDQGGITNKQDDEVAGELMGAMLRTAAKNKEVLQNIPTETDTVQ
jgi:hypothetical protein